MPLENQLHKKQDASVREGPSIRIEDDPLLQPERMSGRKTTTAPSSNPLRSAIIGGLLLLTLWGVNKGREAIFSETSIAQDVAEGIKDGFNESRYDSDLLKGMGERMKEMGYGEMSPAELSDLRDKGLTATWISQVRNLGYNALTIDEATRLKDRDVSTTFISMMQGLGYTLSVDDIIRLKDAGVKAQYTSQLADLGLKNLTIDELIRLKSAGVTVSMVEKLIKQNGGKVPSLEEIIRYRASNQ